MAYNMAIPLISHDIDTRGPIPDRPQNDEEAQQQQAAASLDRLLPFLPATALEHQGFNKAFLKEAPALLLARLLLSLLLSRV